MNPQEPLDKRQYIGTLKQRHRQIRRAYRREIKDGVSVADADKRLIEMQLIRALLAVVGDRMPDED